MSRFLFRCTAYVDADEVEDAWCQARGRNSNRLWINATDRQAVLSAVLLGDDPEAWWHEPGGGCIYMTDDDERAGCERFFEIYGDLFDRVEYDTGGSKGLATGRLSTDRDASSRCRTPSGAMST